MKDHPETTDPCWSKLPVYRPGAKLSADQLNAQIADTLTRDRMLNLGLHGVGIVYGFNVKTDDHGKPEVRKNAIHVGCGLALDRYGRMLFWPGGWLSFDQIIGCPPEHPGCYTLRVHYAEKGDRGRWDRCADDGGWIHRCVAFTLEKGCAANDICPDNLPDDPCLDRRDFICERISKWPESPYGSKDLEFACSDPPELRSSDCGRYGYDPEAGLALHCVALCRLAPEHDDDCPPRIGFCPCDETPDCGCDEGKPTHEDKREQKEGGASSSQEIAQDRPDVLQRPEKDGTEPHDRGCGCSDHTPCDMRQFAYRAPVLWEIANDLDVHLPQVWHYSWQKWALGDWKTVMPIAQFKARTEACENHGRVPARELLEGFTIFFTRPVDADTLHEMSVLMDIYTHVTDMDGTDDKLVAWVQERVPARVEPLWPAGHSGPPPGWGGTGSEMPDWWIAPPDGKALAVRLCPSEAWRKLRRKYMERCTNGGRHGRMEITLRGQLIRDCCGCMFDARPYDLTCRDHCGHKTGQARPGGDWISHVRVVTDDHDPCGDDHDDHDDKTETAQGSASFASQRNGD
ncbi:hypothetical protein HKCCE3408_14630 [Rhodobacterales bacterium HKCCE3408]|nr:hypothetical protein [Rhodobacterales bacterium HKCCE3408]